MSVLTINKLTDSVGATETGFSGMGMPENCRNAGDSARRI